MVLYQCPDAGIQSFQCDPISGKRRGMSMYYSYPAYIQFQPGNTFQKHAAIKPVTQAIEEERRHLNRRK